MSDDLCLLSAAELATMIRRRELSCVEVTQAHVQRIELGNAELNAFVVDLREEALAQAAAADDLVARGATLGPLHGVPLALKDLFEMRAGSAATYGSKPFAHNTAEQTAESVRRLEATGAIVIGKTNTPEFGCKGTTDNLLYGPTLNPFDPERNAGGSSGGSAAAVAAGMAALGQGSDGGGSIRIPAAFCGLFGFKATYGVVPNPGRPDAFGSATPFINASGPLTRSVEDAALMMAAMAGQHRRDPLAYRESIPWDSWSEPARELRISWVGDFGFPVVPEVMRVAGEAVGALADADIAVDQVDVAWQRSVEELGATWDRQIEVLYATINDTFKAAGLDLLEQELSRDFRVMIQNGYEVSAPQYKSLDVVRTEVLDVLEDLFETCDIVATPTCGVPPIRNRDDGETVGPDEVEGVAVRRSVGWSSAFLANFSGHPAASVPAGLDRDGLPVGLQLVGRRGADALVLQAAATLEKVRPWNHLYPRS